MDNKILNNILMNEDMDEIILDKSNSYKFEDNSYKKIIIKENSKINIIEINNKHTKTDYFVENNSFLTINKFYDLNKVKEEINVYLNGINSSVTINLSTISKENQSFKINIFHNNKNTISKTNIHGVTLLDNKIEIENNGYIPRDSKNSELYQDNKIITIKNNNSVIKPNLFIDEFDSSASHGAFIGKFNDETIFYLKSRGIDEKNSYYLLIKGFLINEFNLDKKSLKEVEKIIDKYWR